MRKILILILVAVSLLDGYRIAYDYFKPYEAEAIRASGAIFLTTPAGRQFGCSGTEIGSMPDGGGVFLTARHCVVNINTNKIYEHELVSFSANQGGPYYDTRPIALSLSDDLALLYVVNGKDIPIAKIRDERRLYVGDPTFNVSFPLSTGKEIFHGEYMGPSFPVLPTSLVETYPQWAHTMPMNLTIGHGSSGSGVFSSKQRALIAVAVGTFSEGSYNVAIPSDRVIDFLLDLKDNTVTKFLAANPEKEDYYEYFYEL